MARGVLVAFCIGIGLLAAACFPGYTVTQRLDGEPIAITGRLGGDATDGGCAWIEDAAGKRTQLIWFPDDIVRYDPVRFVDPTGSVIARTGDVVTVTGPSRGVGETSCAVFGDDVFVVEIITGPGGKLDLATVVHEVSVP